MDAVLFHPVHRYERLSNRAPRLAPITKSLVSVNRVEKSHPKREAPNHVPAWVGLMFHFSCEADKKNLSLGRLA